MAQEKESAESMITMKAALGFVMGAATGVAAAALLTPKSGPEMRRTLREKAKGAKEGAQAKAGQVLDKAKEKVVSDTNG